MFYSLAPDYTGRDRAGANALSLDIGSSTNAKISQGP